MLPLCGSAPINDYKKEKSATLPRPRQIIGYAGSTRKVVLYSSLPCIQVWEATFGEVLMCDREPDNASDRYIIAVIGKSIPGMEIILFTNNAEELMGN